MKAQVHLSRLWTDTQVLWLVEERVHLSRLRTDTPVNNTQMKTGAGYTRWTKTINGKGKYECTCHVCGQTHRYRNNSDEKPKNLNKKGGWKGYECTCHVCGQTHRYKRSKRGQCTQREREGEQKGRVAQQKGGEYECTCHVCGQTHKYKEKGFWPLVVKSQWNESTSAPVTSVDRHTSTMKTISKVHAEKWIRC